MEAVDVLVRLHDDRNIVRGESEIFFSAEKLLIVDIQLTEVSLSEYEHIMTSVDATVRRIPPTRINVDLIGCV